MTSDTGAGGLYAAGLQRVRGVWWDDRPETPAEPFLVLRASEREQQAGTGKVFLIEMSVAIGGVERVQADNNFGQPALLAIGARLASRLTGWKPADTGGVVYSAFSRLQMQPGARNSPQNRSSNVEFYSIVASTGLTGGVMTGQSLAITGTLSGGSGGISTTHPFRVDIGQSQQMLDVTPGGRFVNLASALYSQYTHGRKAMRATIGFYGVGGSAPSIPTGQYSVLTITLNTGAVLSGPAYVSQMRVGSQSPDAVQGSYEVTFTGASVQGYGMP